MLDGQQPDFKTYMAANEETGKAVTFVALNKTEAKEMMEKEGLNGYKIVWESTPFTRHADVITDENGNPHIIYKKL